MTDTDTNKIIGYVDSGSLRRGLSVVLYVPTSDIHEGAFVTIDDERFRYYGLVTDIATDGFNPRSPRRERPQYIPPTRLFTPVSGGFYSFYFIISSPFCHFFFC